LLLLLLLGVLFFTCTSAPGGVAAPKILPPRRAWLRQKSCRPKIHPVLPLRVLLAPHTSGPRDVPRCGALSLHQKDAAIQGGSSRNRCRLNVKMCTSVTGGAILLLFIAQSFFESI
jgi:hypothetical protein